MNMPAKTLGLAFQEMQPVLDTFRRNYIKVLEVALKRFEVGNLRVCTVYNGILDLPTIARTALGLFNNIISEKAGLKDTGVIDLRVVCADSECYSDISSIGPSNHGAKHIVCAAQRAFSSAFACIIAGLVAPAW